MKRDIMNGLLGLRKEDENDLVHAEIELFGNIP
jgi:hypothetical protein